MSCNQRPLVAAIAIALLAAFAPAAASPTGKQPEPYALIFGTVFDQQGRAVQGVPIVIRRADKKKPKWNLVSDRRGEFAQRVPAGAAEYIVAVDVKRKKGEAPPPEVRVKIENDERRDISLHLTQ